MITNQIISITDLRQNATNCISDLSDEKIIVVNNKPKAILVDISKYNKLLELEQYKDLLENIRFLQTNGSLKFLQNTDEDLYENY